MKTISKILGCCALALAASCSDKLDENNGGVSVGGSDLMTITATSQQQPDTRTMITAEGWEAASHSIYWFNEDALAVTASDQAGSYEKFTTTTIGTDGVGTATFSGDYVGGSTYYAFYPYDMVSAFSDAGVVTFDLPATQSRTANKEYSFANGAMPAYATSDDGSSFAFANLCGAMRLKLTSTEGATIDEIRISSTTDYLSGAASYNGSALSVSGSQSVSLTFDEVTLSDVEQIFTIVLPPTTATITIEIMNDGEVLNSNVYTSNIAANVVLDISDAWDVVDSSEPDAGGSVIPTADYTSTLSAFDATDAGNAGTVWEITTVGTVTAAAGWSALKTAIDTYDNGAITLIISDNTYTSIPDTSFGATSAASLGGLGAIYAPYITQVGKNAFRFCHKINTIYMPSLTTIDNYAFATSAGDYANTSLLVVDLPEASTVAEQSFANNTALTSIYLPKLTAFGKNSFNACTAVTLVELSTDDDVLLTNLGNGAAGLPSTATPNATLYTNIKYYNAGSGVSYGDDKIITDDTYSLTFSAISNGAAPTGGRKINS